MIGRWLVLWHPDSPGMRVTVWRWLPWLRRSEFATLSEVLRSYRRSAAQDHTR